jgi:protein O-GlcNAc transferase
MTAAGDATRFERAWHLHGQGRLAEAEGLYREILVSTPDHTDALHFLGVLHAQRGDPKSALALIDEAIAADPGNVGAHYNRANTLHSLGRTEEAIACYEIVLSMAPDHAGALTNRGVLLHELGRLQDAFRAYEHGMKFRPKHPNLLYNRGNALRDLGRPDEALASYGAALAIEPRNIEALTNSGNILVRLRRHREAIVYYDTALTVRPGHAETLYNRANLFLETRRFDEALSGYAAAIAAKPGFARAHKGAGNVYFELGRYEDAFAAYDRASGIDPSLDYLEGSRIHVKMHLCDWSGLSGELARLYAHVDEGRRACEPFMLLPTYATSAQHLRSAEIFAADRHKPAPAIWQGEPYRHGKIRVAYLSGEFREQAVAHVTADLFESHDRDAFEIHGLATGLDDGSPMRRRLEAAFDIYADVSQESDRDLAERIHRSEIDILVDLNGYFGIDRTGVFAARPAPVQVNYLGFPGTMGAPYMDYLIADKLVIPPDERHHYSEKIVYLPGCYQPTDRKRTLGARTFTRAGQGLPDTGFVFSCFSTSHKLLPELFGLWMRLLREVEGSVLWLSGPKDAARRNLKREAETRGIAPERIVFAQFVPDPGDHLSRLSLADLFLDTLPHNAHTTATDALIAGVPVITSLGSTMPGRVAASLLNAAGLPELVTHSLAEYEALALELARDTARLAMLKAKLTVNRAACRLFDTPRFARNIETAYRTMRDLAERGLSPESFAVTED